MAVPFIRRESFSRNSSAFFYACLLSQNYLKGAGMGPNSPAKVEFLNIYIYKNYIYIYIYIYIYKNISYKCNEVTVILERRLFTL